MESSQMLPGRIFRTELDAIWSLLSCSREDTSHFYTESQLLAAMLECSLRQSSPFISSLWDFSRSFTPMLHWTRVPVGTSSQQQGRTNHHSTWSSGEIQSTLRRDFSSSQAKGREPLGDFCAPFWQWGRSRGRTCVWEGSLDGQPEYSLLGMLQLVSSHI